MKITRNLPGLMFTALLIGLLAACVPGGATPTEPGVDPTPEGIGGELAGTQWVLESMGTPGSETPAVEAGKVTIQFNANGQVGGSAGCNTYGGQYSVQNGNLSTTEVASTLMACEDADLMQQELDYLAALSSAGAYEINGDQLTVQYNDGQSVLNFVQSSDQPDNLTPTASS
jgi:heat shock protein HslJ